jgi:formylglycine-generating enzyme required for sulfatase activity
MNLPASRLSGVLVLVYMLAGCALPGTRPVDSHTGATSAFSDCAGCPDMLIVPPGSFLMGSPDDEPDKWEGGREDPRHPVTMARSFAIGKFEVTRAQFARYQAETGRVIEGCAHWNEQRWVHDPARNWQAPGFAQADDHPVVCVSWDEASAYAAWLAAKTGKPYRLPTEAEWEYAARAGAGTARYWGQNINDGCAFANISDATLKRTQGVEGFVECDDGHIFTAPVGSYRPNAFGLFDVLGNAWEWTADCWNLGYAGAPRDGSAWLTGDCSMRVPRGASWNSHKNNVRLANRGNYGAGSGFYHIGFRVARDR